MFNATEGTMYVNIYIFQVHGRVNREPYGGFYRCITDTFRVWQAVMCPWVVCDIVQTLRNWCIPKFPCTVRSK
ncbi:hypothetical protein PISMIDRAFT_609559 [Pisolithus microcarpus 441]|uniref:Uncharacterized protein n=1 Tax=Pisolithus microcarpus 441 TaxID=765257 RepID=A0A0D0A890_9AGAM|nr:hypothetical protein PISMIDRAFT_609559 [Pisolithus microcarpus 441]